MLSTKLLNVYFIVCLCSILCSAVPVVGTHREVVVHLLQPPVVSVSVCIMATQTSSNSVSYKNPPKMQATKPYKRWKNEVKLWMVCCGLKDVQQAPALVLSMEENSVKEKVVDELDVDKLQAEDGVKTLLIFLDGIYKQDNMIEAYEAYINFSRFEKTNHMTMEDYVLEYEKKYNCAKAQNMILPDSVLGFGLLDKANLSPEQRQITLTCVDFTAADLYKQMVKALKKFHGIQVVKNNTLPVTRSESSISASNIDDIVKIKVEETLFGSSSYGRNYGKNSRGGGFRFRGQSRPNPQGRTPRVNALGDNGEPMACKRCKSIYHFIKSCPIPADTQTSGNFFAEVSLFTGDNDEEMSLLSKEAENAAVLDSGCPSTVAGEAWISTYLDSLPPEKRCLVKKSKSEKHFKFGAGPPCPSRGEITIPCCLAGTQCNLTTDIVDENIPLLLSKDAMKKSGTILNLETDEATIFGQTVNLGCTSSGHYFVPLADPAVEVVYFSLDGETDDKKTKIVTKLHRQLAHPSDKGLLKLLQDAGMKGECYRKIVDNVSSKCLTCKKYRKTPSRPVVSLPLAQDFNEVLVTDLKEWKSGTYFLHMIDAATRLCKAAVIRDKNPSTIIDKIMTEWVGSGLGKPARIMSDNGGEYANDEFRSMAENLGLIVDNTPGRSPWSNGLCERNHAIVDNNVSKIMEDNPKLPLATALAWACDAKNSLSMVHGWSPYQLVFGRNPRIPTVEIDQLPALENITSSATFAKHINAMHSSREAFVKSEASERIRRALRHKISRSNDVFYQTGDSVFYQRDGKWKGPGRVLGQDGKVVLVRHGSVYVRVHPCHLTKLDVEYNGKLSTENVESPDDNDTIENNIENRDMEQNDNDRNPADNLFQNVPVNNDAPEPQIQAPAVVENPENVQNVNIDQRINDGLRRSARAVERVDYRHLNNHGTTNNNVLYLTLVPKSEQNSTECLDAKQKELEKLKHFKTYDLVGDIGQDRISTRWVMTRKDDKPRARLVARGFEDMDDVQSDSPTVGKSVMRLFLTVVSSKNWKIVTTDITSAFLQGKTLEREVFIIPPVEAHVPDGTLWKLKKCLYGLNDAARQFYLSVANEMSNLNCSQSSLDPSMYYKSNNESQLSGILLSHIDDFLHAGDEKFENDVLSPLRTRFVPGKIENEQFSYVGFQIRQTPDGVYLDMSDYCKNVEIYALSPARLAQKRTLPLLTAEELTMYRSMVGSINWIVHGTRPDMFFELIELSTRCKTATVDDFCTAAKTLKKLTVDEGHLFFPKLDVKNSWYFIVYTDASLANLSDGVSSTFSYIVFLASGHYCSPISWRAGKIKRVVRSTLAAETMALAEGLAEAIYLQKILLELWPGTYNIRALVDNKSLVEAINSTKPVDDRLLRLNIAAIKQLITESDVESVKWCPGSQQLADCMTKKGASGLSLRDVMQTGLNPAL